MLVVDKSQLFVCVCVCGTGTWTQGFTLAKQAFYHLTIPSAQIPTFWTGFFPPSM
jgi:hypothetical protein